MAASTQTQEVGEENRELGKIREDAGRVVPILSPLVKFSKMLSTYPVTSSTLPYSGSESDEK